MTAGSAELPRPALHPPAPLRGVVRAQVRAVGAALGRPALALAALVALATLVIVLNLADADEAIDFHPEYQMLPGMLGMLFPIGVWRGEDRFGSGFLWTLPVDRRWHALAKVGAGWVWLMAAVAVFVLWQLGLALITGGSLLPEETLRVLPGLQPNDAFDASAVRAVPWKATPVLWLVPFTAATATYLLASALALGTRHPLRWILGAVLLLLLVGLVGDATKVPWLIGAPEVLAERILVGRFGLDAVLTAGTETLKTEAVLPSGGRIVVWRGLPDLGQWAVATLAWIVAGAALLWAAASRHRERRRA